MFWDGEGHVISRESKLFFLSPSAQRRTRGDTWSSPTGPQGVTAAKSDDAIWRPVIGPGEVTVTDVTINSLTVTFRESRAADGFFRDWRLEV